MLMFSASVRQSEGRVPTRQMQFSVSHKPQEDLLQFASVVVLQIQLQQEVQLGVLILWILEQQRL